MNLAPLQDVLGELQLTLVHVEDWILVQRANFDLHISEEPYHAVQLYANLVTRKYVVRVWGRTWDWGTLKDINEVRDLCIKNFRSTSACLGYLGPHPGSGLELMEVHFPCSRWISESCAVLFAQRSDDLIIGLCPACSSDKVDIKEEDTKLEKIDPLDMPNHFLLKEEHSTDSALREEIENEPDTALCQSSDDSTGRDILERKSKTKTGRTKMRKMRQLLKPSKKVDQIEELRKIAKLSGVKLPHQRKKDAPKVDLGDYPCDKCGQVLRGIGSLRHHIKAIHENTRDYKCDYPGCDKAFVQSNQLKHHKQSKHEGGFMCYECGKVFSQDHTLQDHIQMIHKGQPLNIKCDHCDMVFHRREARLRHTNLIHFPDKYKCDICQRSSPSAYDLKKHKATHGAPSFECPTCGKGLTTKTSLESHMRKHTGEKNIKCPYCTWVGYSSSELNKHKIAQHKLEREREKMKKRLFRDGHNVLLDSVP